jgi:hypothetical protein
MLSRLRICEGSDLAAAQRYTEAWSSAVFSIVASPLEESCDVLLAGYQPFSAELPCALTRLPLKAATVAGLIAPRRPRWRYRRALVEGRCDGGICSVSRWAAMQLPNQFHPAYTP